MDEQNRSSQGVAGAFLGTRLTMRTRTQEMWQRYTASDEVMQIRQTVQVETLGLTEGQVRSWARYLQDLLKNGGQLEEVNATREILARSVLPVTTVVAFRNHWRFSTPGAAFAAMWAESVQAVTRFNPAAGRLQFAAFMESTLSMRAQALAEDAEGGERKLLERLGSLRSWITELGMTDSVSAQELFAGIQAQLSADEFGHQYFTTPRRVENALDALRVRGREICSASTSQATMKTGRAACWTRSRWTLKRRNGAASWLK